MICFRSIKDFISNYVTVEPVVFIYLAAVFLEMSVLQDLILTKLCLRETNVTDYHLCHNLTDDLRKHLTSEAALWIGYYSATMFLFAIITSSYIGSWSDRFSRKIPMLIPPVGSLLAVSTLIMNSLLLDLHVGWLLLSGAISGASGGIIAIIATTFSYIADITSIENRTKRVMVLEACLFIGGTLGMIIGGALHKKLFSLTDLQITSYSGVFFFELGLIALVILYIYFRVEERHRPERPSDEGRSWLYKLFNINHIKDSFRSALKPRENNYRLYLLMILSASLLINYSLAVQTTLNFVFVSSSPLNWDLSDYSYFTALNFGLSGLALIVGLAVCFHFMKVQDTTLALIGIVSKMAALIMLGISTTSTMIYMTPMLGIFSEFSIPALRSILSKLVDEDEKCKIFALMQLLQNLAMLTGSQIFNQLYDATHEVSKGLCFELVAGLQAVALAIILFIHIRTRPAQSYQSMSINEDVPAGDEGPDA